MVASSQMPQHVSTFTVIMLISLPLPLLPLSSSQRSSAFVHAQSCLNLWSMDCSLSGSSVYGIHQARILESVVLLLPGELPDPRTKPVSPASAGGFFTSELSGKLSSALKVKATQSCLTLWDPMDYTLRGILQARILEWVAFPFSKDLPNPGIEPRSPALQVDSLPAEPPGKTKLQ